MKKEFGGRWGGGGRERRQRGEEGERFGDKLVKVARRVWE